MRAHRVLTVVVGSQLHGLATPTSDTDRASVVVSPLVDVISPFKDDGNKHTEQASGDHVFYELRHLCKLAAQGNPTALEVLWSNRVEDSTPIGQELQRQRTRFLNRKRVYDAHKGYAGGQWRSIANLDSTQSTNKRRGKLVAATIRVYLQGISLLKDGDFSPQVPPRYATLLLRLKQGIAPEEAQQETEFIEFLKTTLDMAYDGSALQTNIDIDWIEEFLVDSYCAADGALR